MAIDTEAKRKSVAAISLYPLGPVPVPDGTIGDFDRQVTGYGYGGIAAVTPGGAVAGGLVNTIRLKTKVNGALTG